MKKPVSLILSISIVTFFATSQRAFASSVQSCAVYPKLHQEWGCKADHYLISFGYYYCRKFVQMNHRFSDFGQTVLFNIRSCLQQTLEAQEGLTCATVRDFAIGSHYDCYVQSGYCQLPSEDKALIAATIANEMRNADMRWTALEIESTCFFSGLVGP